MKIFVARSAVLVAISLCYALGVSVFAPALAQQQAAGIGQVAHPLRALHSAEMAAQQTAALPAAEAIHRVEVRVPLNDAETGQAMRWRLPNHLVPVLLRKVYEPTEEPRMQPHLLYRDVPNKNYRGTLVRLVPFENPQENTHELFVNEKGVFWHNGPHAGQKIRSPYNRDLEYWLLGSAPTRGLQLKVLRLVPVVTFGQCAKLNNLIVQTTPRQCVLANNDILLETDELPTYESLSIADFNGCLEKGKALINTFPRRCLVAGGRVFTETPKSRRAR